MEKLIELLNEYEPYIQSNGTHTDNFWWYVSQWHSAIFPKEVWVERIISKSYRFIQWLVDNDKIDLWKLIMIKDEEQKAIVDIDNSRDNTLLMLLAIQDEPLNFLADIIK